MIDFNNYQELYHAWDTTCHFRLLASTHTHLLVFCCIQLLFRKIWYHRRALLDSYGVRDFSRSELMYIEAVLEEDTKNYHAWSYRQWILMSLDDETVWDEELEYGTYPYSCGLKSSG